MRIGILGAGGIGNAHARVLSGIPGVEVLFHDRSPDRAKEFKNQWGFEGAVSEDSLLSQVDALDICLPTDLHAAAAIKALQAGKSVFCEKPIARTLEQGRSLLQAAEASDGIFMPGQVVRFFPEFRRGHELVKAGAIGTPAAVRTRRGGRAPTGSDSWFRNFERSGGVLLDVGIHDFDWLRWTFGEVASLTASASPDHRYALTILEMECGAVAHVESTWLDPGGFSTAFEVAGSKGLISHDSRTNASLWLRSADENKKESNFSAEDDPFHLELSEFVSAMKEKRGPSVTGADGFAALAIALAAIESARTGCRVKPERP